MTQGEWTFLSNYGHVLVSLARDPDARMRDVAQAVGITERAVQQIVRELVGQGYLHKEKVAGATDTTWRVQPTSATNSSHRWPWVTSSTLLWGVKNLSRDGADGLGGSERSADTHRGHIADQGGASCGGGARGTLGR